MNKLIPVLGLLVILSSCSKKYAVQKFEGYNFLATSCTVLHEIDGINTKSVSKLHIDNKGVVWAGTFDKGLIRIEGDEAKLFTTANSGLPGDNILSITSDQNGVIWGGTNDGLFKFDGQSFESYDTTNSEMIVNFVYAVAVDHSENIWFSNGNSQVGGLMRFDQTDEWTLFTTANSQLQTGIIKAIHVDTAGTVWAGHGTFQGIGGIWTMDTSGAEKVYTIDNSNLIANWISEIKTDPDGNIWIGTDEVYMYTELKLHGGLQQFQNNDFITHNPSESGLSGNKVLAVDFDDAGNIWISTDPDAPNFGFRHEVAVYNHDKWIVLSKEISQFPNVRVSDIKIHKEDVWMSSQLGLIHIKLVY